MRIRNANEQTNYGMDFEEQNTDVTKGIIFAVVGMLVGIIVQLIMGGFFDRRMGWIVGAIIGAAISFGYSFGKGRQGSTRQITVVGLAILGVILGVWGGYVIHVYRWGFARNLSIAMSLVSQLLGDGFFGLFSDFGSLFDDTVHGEMLRDIGFGSIVAIAVAWKAWGIKENDYDGSPEVLYETENLNGLNDLPSAMDDVLSQDIPTLELDETNSDNL